jgi:hypothetical protein
MLTHFLRAAGARRVPLIASKVANFPASGYASQSILINDLPIQAGDLIVFTSSSYVLTNPTTISVTGYTSAYSIQGSRLRAATFYKTASSLESSINFEWTGGTASDVSCVVAVFRGYQYNSSGTATSTNTDVNPPSISCSINDLIIATYHSENGGATIQYPSGYVAVNRTVGGDETYTLMAYKIATSTSENPPAVNAENEFGVGGTIRCTTI